ncbi:MAG: aldolase/citrate lyase family protein [Candidatus Bathyarchaeia archaeon]|nr:2,4-dihydroxyhept-2-ene-1,7-dioic acid aldolase [Candidatus Bathyarchaeota archaeon]
MYNPLKAKLRRREVTFGVTVGLGCPEVSEALGNIGLDWISFDMQHTSLDTETVQAMVQAMSCSNSVPIIRITSNDPGLINRALDIGAYAVIIPLVNSREDAEDAVRASRYPPKGIRSWGPRRPALRDPDYAATANEEIMVIPQIETEHALKNLEDIVTTEGIEAVFLGPMDLSMSLGIFRQFEDPKFLRSMDRVVSVCEAHNVSPGLLAPIGPVEKSIEQGFKLISLGGDLRLLIDCVEEILKRSRSITNSGIEA